MGRRMPRASGAAAIAEWGQALVFIAIGLIAASVALGARPDADQAAETASRGVLAIPGGPFVLGLVGIGIGVGGIAFIVMGIRRSFESTMSLPSGALGAWVKGLGLVGFIAKGVALVILGILLLVAAVTVDPSAAGILGCRDRRTPRLRVRSPARRRRGRGPHRLRRLLLLPRALRGSERQRR